MQHSYWKIVSCFFFFSSSLFSSSGGSSADEGMNSSQELAAGETRLNIPPALGQRRIPISGAPGSAIILPIDGSQPKMAVACEWSLARGAPKDRAAADAITRFYVRLFLTGDLLGGSLLEIPGEADADKDALKKDFTTIAASFTGRLLLYRILIELKRERAQGKEPCAEVQSDELLGGGYRRADALRPEIAFGGAYKFAPGLNGKKAQLFVLHKGLPPPRLSVLYRGDGLTYYCAAPEPIALARDQDRRAVALFHELLHWYHFLRNPARYGTEVGGADMHAPRALSLANTDPDTVADYFWDVLDNNPAPGQPPAAMGHQVWKASMLPWIKVNGSEVCVNLEEIRTILGLPWDAEAEDFLRTSSFLEGDELSENLFRMELGLPLRFGHRHATSAPDQGGDLQYFQEDARVIQKLIDVRTAMKGRHPPAPPAVSVPPQPFDGLPLPGLGSFKACQEGDKVVQTWLEKIDH